MRLDAIGAEAFEIFDYDDPAVFRGFRGGQVVSEKLIDPHSLIPLHTHVRILHSTLRQIIALI